MSVTAYSYEEFLRRVQAHQLHVRGRTGPTGCWVCDTPEVFLSREEQGRMGRRALQIQARERCRIVSGGIVDAHHLLPKRLLRKESPDREVIRVPGREFDALERSYRPLDVALMDPRNGILVRRYHHDALEGRALAIPKELWPDDALAFARELGLEWWIDNMESRRT